MTIKSTSIFKKAILLTLSTTAFLFTLNASAHNHTTNKNKEGVALDGHDVVAYFKDGQTKSVDGLKNFSHTHQETTYYFSSKENLEMFKASPEKYLPAYGGYCAWAVSASSDIVPVDYDTFKIETDKNGNKRLLLFYNKFFINTLSKWNKKSGKNEGGSAKLIDKADQNWLKIKASKK